MAKRDPAKIMIFFQMPVLPEKIIFIPNPDSGLYPKKINVY